MSYNERERDVLNGWADVLNRPDWSVFATFTTNYRTTKRSARRKMEHLQSNLCRVHGGETIMFWVAEPFVDLYRFHTHALIKISAPQCDQVEAIKNSWHQVCRPSGSSTRGLSYVVKYDCKEGGRFYIAKHLNKENVDYDIFIGLPT